MLEYNIQLSKIDKKCLFKIATIVTIIATIENIRLAFI